MMENQSYININSLIKVFILVLFCFSCSKKAHIFEKDIYNSEQKQLVTNWGQTVNGRWIPYLLKKAKKESKNSDTQKSIELFAHYMQTL